MKRGKSFFITTACAMLLTAYTHAADIPEDARVTDYVYENIDNGTPEGWDMGMCYLGPSYGVDNSNGIVNDSYVADTYLTTHYVRMGSDPHFKFEYKIYNINFMGGTPMPATPENVTFSIEVSDNAGESWQTVYSISPENGDATYQPSADFQTMDIALTAYKDKTCQVRIHMPYFLSMELDYCQFIFDNFEIGTLPSTDMSVSALSGTAFPAKGQETTYKVSVSNQSNQPSADYTLQLTDDKDNVLATIPSKEIAAQSTETFTFGWTPSEEGNMKIKAVVTCDGDIITSNNETAWMNISVTNEATQPLTIGTESGEYDFCVPINLYSRNSYTQTIYKENQLSTNRLTIRGVSYNTKFGQPMQTSTFQVYIGTSDVSDFSAGEWIDNNTLTKVFDGTVYVDNATQKLEIAFDIPYEYTGGNLVICTLRNGKDFFYNYLFSVDKSSSYAAATMQAYNDDVNTPIDPANPSGNIMSHDMIPVTTIIADKYPSGNISGTVKAGSGTALADATIAIKGLQRSTKSDENGNYQITDVAPGEYTLVFSAYKFFDKEVAVTVESDKTTTANALLDEIARYDISGTVKDAAGNPVKGATVQALGYYNTKSNADENGNFTLTGIYSNNDTYTIRASAPYYEATATSLTVTDNIEGLELVTEEYLDMPYNVSAKAINTEAEVTWNAPLHLFRYDAPGQPVSDYLGYTGWNSSVIGTAFPHKTQLYEIQWYVGGNVPHESVNIVIIQLDDTGWPTRQVITTVDNAPSTDNEWSSYKFEMPLSTPNGFFIGLNSGSVAVNIGMTDPTEEYPVVAGRYFSCDDINFNSDERSRFADLSLHYNSNLLIRAIADDYGEIDYNLYNTALANSVVANGRPDNIISYDIYRIVNNAPEDEWTLVGEQITGMEYTDETFGELPEKTMVQYAVVANYASGKSEASKSESIEKTTGINSPDAGKEVTRIRVINLLGMMLYNGTPDGLDKDAIPAGIYIVQKQYTDGTSTTVKTAIGK